MKMDSWSVLLVVIVSGVFDSDIYGRCSVVVKRFEHCDPNSHYDQMFNLTFKTVDNKQYVDGMMTLKRALDNTLRVNASVEMLIGKRSVYLFSINDGKACDALHKFLGEFVYDLERNAQLIPGMCPLPQGRHQVHNVLLDFTKITTIGNFPFGNLRIIINVHDRKNNIYSCFIIEIDNFNN